VPTARHMADDSDGDNAAVSNAIAQSMQSRSTQLSARCAAVQTTTCTVLTAFVPLEAVTASEVQLSYSDCTCSLQAAAA